MTVVQPGRLNSSDKELGSVGVGSSIGHAHDAWSGVLESKVLIFEFITVNGLSTSAIVVCKITSLAHEVGDDAMECGALVSIALLAGAQGTEVFASLWNDISAKLKAQNEKISFD